MSLSIFNIISRVFFPKRCYLCKRDAAFELCDLCRSLCRTIVGNQGPIKSVFHYDETIRALILGAKVGHHLHFAHLLADLFRETLPTLNLYRELINFNPSAIVIVPSRPFFLFQRGFDLNILMARALNSVVKVPMVHLLECSKKHRKLSRIENKNERFQAIVGSFSLKRFDKFDRLILMDDIVTSGATLMEAKKTLLPVKAQVFSLTVAKTPFF